jgi:hypothetical protein
MRGMRPGPSRKVHYRIATSASAKTRRASTSASAWAPVASVWCRRQRSRRAGRDDARAARSASRLGYPGDGNGVIM